MADKIVPLVQQSRGRKSLFDIAWDGLPGNVIGVSIVIKAFPLGQIPMQIEEIREVANVAAELMKV